MQCSMKCSLLALLLAVLVESSRLRASSRMSRRAADARWPNMSCKIFTMWDYQHGAPFYVQKDVQSWEVHTHQKCGAPILINSTNVKQYIPDVPDAFFKLPDIASQSDFVRYALLYHNGGMYLDTDMLMAKDVDDVLDKIHGDYDLVSYSNGQEGCRWFSSNFLAGRKGSTFHKAVWEKQKEILKQDCATHPGEKEVCCRSTACHIPWAGLGEVLSHPLYDSWIEKKEPFKSYCYMESEGQGFNAEGSGTVFYNKPTLAEALPWWKNVQKGVNPLGRMVYHLFNSQGFHSHYSDSAIFDPNLVVGSLFRQSLEGFADIPALPWQGPPAKFCADGGHECTCTGKAYFGLKFNRVNGKEAKEPMDFRGLTTWDYRVKDVEKSIMCHGGSDAFQDDPHYGSAKQCFCQAAAPKHPKTLV